MTALKQFRKSLKLSSEAVAHQAGLTQKAYWSIENGLTDPRLSNLLKISSALNIEVGDLIKLLLSDEYSYSK